MYSKINTMRRRSFEGAIKVRDSFLNRKRSQNEERSKESPSISSVREKKPSNKSSSFQKSHVTWAESLDVPLESLRPEIQSLFRRHSNEHNKPGFSRRKYGRSEERNLGQQVRPGFRRSVQEANEREQIGGYMRNRYPRNQRKSGRGKEVVGFLGGNPTRDFGGKQSGNYQEARIEYVPTPVTRLVDQEEALSMIEEEYAPLRKPVRLLNRQVSMIDELIFSDGYDKVDKRSGSF